jgi:hypothetical protein
MSDSTQLLFIVFATGFVFVLLFAIQYAAGAENSPGLELFSAFIAVDFLYAISALDHEVIDMDRFTSWPQQFVFLYLALLTLCLMAVSALCISFASGRRPSGPLSRLDGSISVRWRRRVWLGIAFMTRYFVTVVHLALLKH